MTRSNSARPSRRRRPTPNLECLEERQMLNASPVWDPSLGITVLPVHQPALDKAVIAASAQAHHNLMLQASSARIAENHPKWAAAVATRQVRLGLAKADAVAAFQTRHGVPTAIVSIRPRDILSVTPDAASPPANAYGPSQIRKAYGFDQLPASNQGQGMTIAIVLWDDAPTILNDVNTFSTQYGLPLMNSGGSNPTFTKFFVDGTPSGNTDTALETSLDVEWVHAMAPYANIDLVEANNVNNVFDAVQFAKNLPNVVTINNSWGGTYTNGGRGEFNGETSFDSFFAQPANHNPVTFNFSTGDDGFNGSYPAYSPLVVAVGGTSLFTLSGAGRYGTELGWSGSGGGTSLYEPKPAYQTGSFFTGLTKRSIPDLSFVADLNTGVAIYDSYGGYNWIRIGGTSVSAPIFTGFVGLVDQARAANGFAPLSTSDLLTKVYNDYNSANYANDFHDVIGGNNGGFNAVAGYDLVTGVGTPKVANLLATLSATA